MCNVLIFTWVRFWLTCYIKEESLPGWNKLMLLIVLPKVVSYAEVESSACMFDVSVTAGVKRFMFRVIMLTVSLCIGYFRSCGLHLWGRTLAAGLRWSSHHTRCISRFVTILHLLQIWFKITSEIWFLWKSTDIGLRVWGYVMQNGIVDWACFYKYHCV